MQINLEDKLFHSIRVYNVEDDSGFIYKTFTKEEIAKIIKLKLDCIYNAGYILPKKDIKSTYGAGNFCKANYNGNEYISVAIHPARVDEIDKDITYVDMWGPPAWNIFQLNSISLVLNSSLLAENRIVLNNKRMVLERQLIKPIDIKYIEAISLPTTQEYEPFFDKNCSIESILRNYNPSSRGHILNLKAVLEFINKHNLDIPIVDINSGRIYQGNPEYREKIKSMYIGVKF